MGLRGPKPGFRDAQREHSARQGQAGRPRYARGDGKPVRKLTGAAKKIWDRVIESTSDSGNIREVGYVMLEEFCELAAQLPGLRRDLAQATEAGQWDKANQISMILNRTQDQVKDIAARYLFDPKAYLGAVEASPGTSGPTSIDRILAS